MVRSQQKIAVTILMLVLLPSCAVLLDPMPKGWNWGLKPRPLVGPRNFPSADTEYGQGFKHGCEMGFDAVSKGALSDIKHGFIPQKMAGNPDYSAGYWDGFEQCTYILDWDVV